MSADETRERERGGGAAAAADGEGLQVRPGGALVPGLRRLRDPERGAGLHARARPDARADRVRVRDRLRRALPVLHADLRDALDPRPRAGDRDGLVRVPSGPVRLGRDRRRRRALDRRQPPDPRAAPERQLQDPALQQRGLRAHEGPVLADLAAGDDHEDVAARLARPSVQPAVAGDRRRGVLRRAGDRHGQEGARRGAAGGGAPQGQRLRRDLPELQHLQRRRVRLRARAEGEPDLPAPRRADHLGRQGRAVAPGRLAGDRRRVCRGPADPRRACHGAGARVRAVPHDAGGDRRDPDGRLPLSRAPGLRRADGRADRAPRRRRAKASSARCSAAATPGRSS